MFDQNDLKAIDKKVDHVITILTKESRKAWPQITPMATPQANPQRPAAMKSHIHEARKERSQYEITLTTSNAPTPTRESIETMPHKDITSRLQKAIDSAALPGKPQIQGVNKLGREIIRMRAETKEGARAVKEANIDWNEEFPGMTAYKPKYGIVVHGVPTHAINFDPATNTDDVKNEWETQNASSKVTITHIKPLRKARKRHRPTAHQSIVVFTENAEAADQCIKHGFAVEKQILKAERYAPHLHITQCYKCHKYGHRAANCKKKEKCGKCADNHTTAECTSETIKCVNCDGPHEAWHVECLARTTEAKRLAGLRMETSPFYTEC
jgi:hypothetical protein